MFHLFDLGLQMSQLDALLQVPAVLLGGQVQLLLLLVEELQQVLNTGRHVHVTVAEQLDAWRANTTSRDVKYTRT